MYFYCKKSKLPPKKLPKLTRPIVSCLSNDSFFDVHFDYNLLFFHLHHNQATTSRPIVSRPLSIPFFGTFDQCNLSFLFRKANNHRSNNHCDRSYPVIVCMTFHNCYNQFSVFCLSVSSLSAFIDQYMLTFTLHSFIIIPFPNKLWSIGPGSAVRASHSFH